MIKERIILKENKPVAVILDIEEYRRLKELETDFQDLKTAHMVKQEESKYITMDDLEEELGIK